MTDKQIIIDGIDVSKCSDISGHVNDFGEYECLCRCIFGDGTDDYGVIGHEMCKDNPNCHYKNWQRKEQECERLKTLKDETYFRLKDEYIQQLDQLKAENDTYKKMLEDEDVQLALTEIRSGERHLWRNKAEKLSKALAEIKEIIKDKHHSNQFFYCFAFNECSRCLNEDRCLNFRILRKISEVQK